MEQLLSRLRNAGWIVACHHDDRHPGKFMTTYLFTHPHGEWMKGEGPNDQSALAACVATAYRFYGDTLIPPER